MTATLRRWLAGRYEARRLCADVAVMGKDNVVLSHPLSFPRPTLMGLWRALEAFVGSGELFFFPIF